MRTYRFQSYTFFSSRQGRTHTDLLLDEEPYSKIYLFIRPSVVVKRIVKDVLMPISSMYEMNSMVWRSAPISQMDVHWFGQGAHIHK